MSKECTRETRANEKCSSFLGEFRTYSIKYTKEKKVYVSLLCRNFSFSCSCLHLIGIYSWATLSPKGNHPSSGRDEFLFYHLPDTFHHHHHRNPQIIIKINERQRNRLKRWHGSVSLPSSRVWDMVMAVLCCVGLEWLADSSEQKMSLASDCEFIIGIRNAPLSELLSNLLAYKGDAPGADEDILLSAKRISQRRWDSDSETGLPREQLVYLLIYGELLDIAVWLAGWLFGRISSSSHGSGHGRGSGASVALSMFLIIYSIY